MFVEPWYCTFVAVNGKKRIPKKSKKQNPSFYNAATFLRYFATIRPSVHPSVQFVAVNGEPFHNKEKGKVDEKRATTKGKAVRTEKGKPRKYQDGCNARGEIISK